MKKEGPYPLQERFQTDELGKKWSFATLPFRLLCALLLLFSLNSILASPVLSPLHSDKIFQISAQFGQDQSVLLNWRIAPGYHLYREQFRFQITSPPEAKLGQVLIPAGQKRQDKFYGKHRAFSNQVSILVPIVDLPKDGKIALLVRAQGCSDDGYCYPPMAHKLTLNFEDQKIAISRPVSSTLPAQTPIENVLATQPLLIALLSFYLLGLLLSFSPCVLPMIPILSSIIVGEKRLSTQKAFLLSLTYVLSMATTYGVIGLCISLIGQNLQQMLQQSWAIVLLAILFVGLALSLFGVYEMNLPQKLYHCLNKASHRQAGGSYLGVAIMGSLATLILSPCITPALFGALTYIAHTGDIVLGGSALFSLGFGMGTPLLMMGTLFGQYLPKTGQWNQLINRLFGCLMLGMAIWLLSRILPGPFSLILWAALCLIAAAYLDNTKAPARPFLISLLKSLRFLLLIYAGALVIGASMGHSNPLSPLSRPTNTSEKENVISFYEVRSLPEAKAQLNQAKLQKKPVVLDFYADWCLTCEKLDKTVFKDPKVKSLLKPFKLIRANVTEFNTQTQALQKYFNVIAPPTLIFFDAKGQWIRQATLIGDFSKEQVIKQTHLISR